MEILQRNKAYDFNSSDLFVKAQGELVRGESPDAEELYSLTLDDLEKLTRISQIKKNMAIYHYYNNNK
jgi:hypothetical protein